MYVAEPFQTESIVVCRRILASFGRPCQYDKGIELFRQDAAIETVYLLERGVVKLLRQAEDGRAIIVALRYAPWLLGSVAVILNRESPCTAQTTTSCELLAVPSTRLLAEMAKHCELAAFVHRSHAVELYTQIVSYASLGLGSVRQRFLRLVAATLRGLHADVTQRHGGVKLDLSQREIAEALACTPEHLSRVLAQLRRDKLVRWRGRSLLIVDPALVLASATGF
jgi:CRP-like cAMP-binding protein